MGLFGDDDDEEASDDSDDFKFKRPGTQVKPAQSAVASKPKPVQPAPSSQKAPTGGKKKLFES